MFKKYVKHIYYIYKWFIFLLFLCLFVAVGGEGYFFVLINTYIIIFLFEFNSKDTKTKMEFLAITLQIYRIYLLNNTHTQEAFAQLSRLTLLVTLNM
jgi:hypothetical protein